MIRLIWFRLVLSFALIFTSQAMAVARAAPDAAGQMVICIGAHAVTVYTDTSGAPVRAPQFCPDCTLVCPLTADRDPDLPLTLTVVASALLEPLAHQPPARGLRPEPRGPPVFS